MSICPNPPCGDNRKKQRPAAKWSAEKSDNFKLYVDAFGYSALRYTRAGGVRLLYRMCCDRGYPGRPGQRRRGRLSDARPEQFDRRMLRFAGDRQGHHDLWKGIKWSDNHREYDQRREIDRGCGRDWDFSRFRWNLQSR